MSEYLPSESLANTYSTTSMITQNIKNFARDLGFDAVGCAKVEKLPNESQQMREWLDSGFQGDMHYLERNLDRREDVRLIVPGAHSVIVVAKNYYTPTVHVDRDDSGKISRYAWGDDYHDIMSPLLASLCQHNESLVPGSVNKYYVDTGPVMEKQWAVRAGIGWQAKHSNIISTKLGSFFFLGVVISTLELEYDEMIADHCGTCTACIDSCPTKAIIDPYVVDATKCISYWTIESKSRENFPDHITRNVDGWLYGCDTCQDVCPWNRFKQISSETAFEPRLHQSSLGLDQVQEMTQEEFSTRFKNSPIKRAKLEGLKRNARVLKDWSTY